jgi:tryptophanyl-tRNA synthetase
LRKIYDPDNYLTSWEECRQGLRGCTQNKKELADILNAMLDPIRKRREELESNPEYVDEVLRKGAERARAVAEETMREVRAAMKLRP